MKRISTSIETKQIEILQANDEIAKGSKCYKDYLFVDVLGDEFVAYPTPEAAIADTGRMVSDILYDENYLECSGELCFCVNVVVDAYRRDEDEPNFSSCDQNEVSHLILDNRKKKEAEADKEEGFTKLEGSPFKIENIVFHDAVKEKPKPNELVIVLLRDGVWFIGSNDGYWRFVEGEPLDPAGFDESDVVAWFRIPNLLKIQ